jgi:hypothetical protein
MLLHLFYKGGRDVDVVTDRIAALLEVACPRDVPQLFIKSMGDLYGGKTLWYVEFALPLPQ